MIAIKRKFTNLIRKSIYIGLVIACTSCQLSQCELDPNIVYIPSSRTAQLPSAFPPLTAAERQQEWAKELLIGDAFAREFDLYRAITGYKRALILLPPEAAERRLQIEYDIALCYYLGNKYQEAIEVYESGYLISANYHFSPYNQLLLMMYDCYLHVGREEKAQAIYETIQKLSPDTGADLAIYEDLIEGRVCEAQCEIEQHRDFASIQPDMDTYYRLKKSPSLARKLNALLPGAGYYYIGQYRTAVTALLINALFILASYECFRNGYPAAGIITASLEGGWYIGGINGVGIEAQEYNNRLFEGVSKKILKDNCFFPVLMFETTF